MTIKTIWLDLETTGIDTNNCGIIQISYFIEKDGKLITSMDLNIAPFVSDEIDDRALEINKKTIEEIFKQTPPELAFTKIIKNLDEFVNKYDKDDKLYIAGYNVDFDLKFLKRFFEKNNHPFGSYFNCRKLDVIRIVDMLEVEGKIPVLKSHKLKDVCEFFGIDLIAHDAKNDIIATKKLYKKLKEIAEK